MLIGMFARKRRVPVADTRDGYPSIVKVVTYEAAISGSLCKM